MLVVRFTEKQIVIVAEKFLKQSAFWDGGVFAFRLGYVMNIVRKYITSDSFEDIRYVILNFLKYLSAMK